MIFREKDDTFIQCLTLLSINAEKCNRKFLALIYFILSFGYTLPIRILRLSGISSLVCVKYYSRTEGKLARPQKKQPDIWHYCPCVHCVMVASNYYRLHSAMPDQMMRCHSVPRLNMLPRFLLSQTTTLICFPQHD